MRYRWVLGLAVVVALVLAVVLVRPGSQAGPDDLAVPSADPPPEATDPLLRPDALASLGLTELPVSASGIGPLQLGLSLDSLEAAGWGVDHGEAGCVRLRPVSTTDSRLTGWAVDGVVVAAQVEAVLTDVDEVDSGAGFSFGTPVQDARDPGSTATYPVGGPTGVELSVARWSVDGSRITASDLGLDGIRYAEVVDDAGIGCELPPELVSGPASIELAAVEDVVDGISGDNTGHQYLWSIGATTRQLGTTDWALTLDAVTGTGCEVVDRQVDGDALRLWLQDGTVVGQDFELDVSDALAPGHRPGDGWVELISGQVIRADTTTVSRPPASGFGPPESTSELLVASELVPELDTVVVTGPPVVTQQMVGVACDTGEAAPVRMRDHLTGTQRWIASLATPTD